VVDVLDVGQGDAILVRAGGKTVLIDAGTAGANVALRLQAMGVYTIDLLIATHAHADHIGGMEDVVRALRVQRYLDSGQAHTTQTWARLADALSEHGTAVLGTAPGQVIKLSDDVLLKVLGPPATPFTQTRSDLNANSVVLLIDHGDVELLLPGDAEAPTEEWLVANGLPDVEVLKVAHHGSSHSSIPGAAARREPGAGGDLGRGQTTATTTPAKTHSSACPTSVPPCCAPTRSAPSRCARTARRSPSRRSAGRR
jgi:competence protein ComEC